MIKGVLIVMAYLNFIKRAKVLVILNKIIFTFELVRIKEMKKSPVKIFFRVVNNKIH